MRGVDDLSEREREREGQNIYKLTLNYSIVYGFPMEKDEDTNGLEGRGKFLAMRKTKEFRQQPKQITKGMIVPSSFLRPGFILLDHALGAQGTRSSWRKGSVQHDLWPRG